MWNLDETVEAAEHLLQHAKQERDLRFEEFSMWLAVAVPPGEKFSVETWDLDEGVWTMVEQKGAKEYLAEALVHIGQYV